MAMGIRKRASSLEDTLVMASDYHDGQRKANRNLTFIKQPSG